MDDRARQIERTYLLLTLLATLAASFIWGINTLFLLDAGLSNAEAFGANAFFAAGEVIFEVPTGVVADTWGRRTSYLLGAGTLLLATLLYLAMWKLRAPMWAWAVASMALGLGFTFFSGATEAWLVDALTFAGDKGALDGVFAKAQVVTGVAMLTGSVGGGLIAQATNLGVPYLIRAVVLGLTLVAAAVLMHDLGFTPARKSGIGAELKTLLRASLDAGWRNPPVRWLMLAELFTGGVGIFGFYAMQPHLLKLWGNPHAFGIAGLAAAIVAGAQIAAGLGAPFLRRLFTRRTHVLLLAAGVSTVCLCGIGLTSRFWLAIGLLVFWGLGFSITMPVRQTFLNAIIPSAQRATVLSFDNLMTSAGGVATQPLLGRLSDVSGYPAAYLVSAGIQSVALPFLWLTRRQKVASDNFLTQAPPPEPPERP